MRALDTMMNFVKARILGKSARAPPSMLVFLEHFLDVEALKDLRCPICGRSFSSRRALLRHVSACRGCGAALMSRLHLAASVYNDFRSRLRKTRRGYVINIGGDVVVGRSVKDVAMEFVRRRPHDG